MTEMNMIGWPGWETVSLIGRGSFGAVYEIRRDIFGEVEKAALKVISIPQDAGDIAEMRGDGYDDESITETFKNHMKSIVGEYSLMRKLNGSANVVSCDDVRYVQHADGIGWDIYIKMELLTPLMTAMPQDYSEEAVLKVANDLCSALVLCQKYGIVHRDIKPQNIFVSDNGDYKLGDFGVAKTVEKTTGGTKIGTYKYMAPEVYNNQPYGTGADIYSLGLVLYWMMNQRRLPFVPLPPEKPKAGTEERARALRFAGNPIPAPCHGSEQLKRIVLKACAFNPADRYQSAREMKDALESISSRTPDPEPVMVRGIPIISDEPEDKTTSLRPDLEAGEDDSTVGLFGPRKQTSAAQEEEARQRQAQEARRRQEQAAREARERQQREAQRRQKEREEALRREQQARQTTETRAKTTVNKTKTSTVFRKGSRGKTIALICAGVVVLCLLVGLAQPRGWRTGDFGVRYYESFGRKVTGWYVIDGNTYYFDDSGSMQVDLCTIDGKTYYLRGGILQTGWHVINQDIYYFDSNGVMQTGWVVLNEEIFYFDETGAMQTGTVYIEGQPYSFDADGRLLS